MKGFAQGLTLKQWRKATRKSPIASGVICFSFLILTGFTGVSGAISRSKFLHPKDKIYGISCANRTIILNLEYSQKAL